MADAQEAVRAQALLARAYQALGSWDRVAEKVGDVDGEALRKIHAGVTKRPTRRTLDKVFATLERAPLAPGLASQIEEAADLARRSLAILERVAAYAHDDIVGILDDPMPSVPPDVRPAAPAPPAAEARG